ncbi:MAG: amidohydrolase [Limnochordia bacterium]|jgi:imidazolonepropionase-like amidohydrolase
MLAIKNAKIITVTQGIIEQGTVLVDEGKIKAVGQQVAVPADAEVIDGTGKVLSPGLIDAHSHAGLDEEGYGSEGWDYNEAVDPATPWLRAIDGINPTEMGLRDAAANGVTTVCVVPGSANVLGGEGVIIHTYGNVVDEMVVSRDAGLKVAFGENPKRVYQQQKKMPTTRMGTAAILREHLVKAANYMAKLERGEKDPEKTPERDLRMENLVRVLRREIPLRAHAHRADDMMTALRIAEEFNVRIVIEHATEGHKIAEQLARRQVPAVVGPSLSSRSKVELQELDFRTAAVLNAEGVKVALTLDHPVIPLKYLPVVAALAVRYGLPEQEAWKAITINPAEILGIDDRVGSIEVGKAADLVLWSGDPLDVRSRAERVLIDGRIVG